MAYVTYTNRTSEDYRFTVDTLDDPTIASFKEILKSANRAIINARKRGYDLGNTKGIRIRPRGPRAHCYARETPIKNATHFDVYVREYK